MAVRIALSIGAGHVTVVAASWGLVLVTVLMCLAVPCGIVTAMKGRRGWFVLGLMTAGLFWIVGALQPPMPVSLWRRWRAGRTARHG